MEKRSVLRNTFAVKEHHGSFYTAGHPVRPAADGKHVFCVYDENVNVVELHTGKIPFYLPGDGEQITAMDVHVATNQIVFASQSQLLYHWKANENYQILLASEENESKLEPVAMQTDASSSPWPSKERSDEQGSGVPRSENLPWKLHKRWKGHLRPVADMTIDSTGHFLATSSVDGTVRVWDLEQGFCTHSFKGHEGLVSLVKFHPDPKRLQLVSAGQDCTVRVWDLVTKSCKVLESHMSLVTSLAFINGGWDLVTAGRDKVMSVWDLRRFELKKTIPVFESLEGIMVAPKGVVACMDKGAAKKEELVVTCGEKGQLKLWNCTSGECVATEKEQLVPVGYQQLQPWMADGEEKMLLVTDDSCFASYDASLPLAREKFVVGFYDEILGVRSVLDNAAILMNATSEKLLLFDRETFTCSPLVGHTDVVMAIDTSADGRLAASGGKDHTARVWDLETHECIAVCSGHTESIGAVAFSKKSRDFIVTGGADKTIKYWDVSSATSAKRSGSSAPVTCHAGRTIKAHDKEINSVAVAPNDSLVATGSQDKLVKVWDTESLSLKGTLKGHKRGVWCVNFSPVDKCLVSGSADKTIKIWSLSDFSCLRTLEGHTGSVLSANFLSMGMQLLTSGSDGLLKLWTIRTSECVNTFEKHFDRVWATTVLRDGEEILSAGADSILNVFEDVTETVAEEQEKQREELILQEQELSNHLRAKEYRKAVRIALRLDQPFRIRSIIEELLDNDDKETLDDIVLKLSPDDLSKCLQYVRDWNTNARHSLVAQAFFRCILSHTKPEAITSLPLAKDLLLGLIPYTERHAARMDLLLQKSFLIDYTLHRMHQLTPQGLDGEGAVSFPSVVPERAARKGLGDVTMMEGEGEANGSLMEAMTVTVTEESDSDSDSGDWEGGDSDGFGDWIVPTAPTAAAVEEESSARDSAEEESPTPQKKTKKMATKKTSSLVEEERKRSVAREEESPASTKQERKEKRKRRQQLKRKAGDVDDSPFSPARKKSRK